MNVFDANRKTNQLQGDAKAHFFIIRLHAVGRVPGQGGRGFRASQTWHVFDEAAGLQHGDRIHAPVKGDGHHPAKAIAERLFQIVTSVVDFVHEAEIPHGFGKRLARRRVGLHADGKGAHAAQQHGACRGMQKSANQSRLITDRFDNRFIRDQGSANHVRVSVEVFRRTLEHDVGAEGQGFAQHRAGKGVVAQGQ